VLRVGRTRGPGLLQGVPQPGHPVLRDGGFRRGFPLLEQVLETDSTQSDVYFLLYDINRELGDTHEARRWLERYPDGGARAADKYQLLGELAETNEESDRAALYYRQLIDIAPGRRWGHYRLVESLFHRGNPLSAVQQAQQSLQRFPAFAELALMAGNRAFEERMLRKAEHFYAAAYRSGSAGGVVGLQNLKRVYEEQGDARGQGRVVQALLAGSGVAD
jgi:tetratricopeptide (TPR) repeat protein